jgi:large exoprotein involved in heme utilization and adhesion
LFANGFEFSAAKPQSSSLLTVSVPVGLGFGNNSGEILVRGLGHNFINQGFSPILRGFNSQGLQVRPGRTLALIGGKVTLEGGVLAAPGGYVQIGSTSSGTVGFDPNLILNYEGASFDNVRFAQRSVVDVSGVRSGSIGVRARNIEFVDGSVLFARNLGDRDSGRIGLTASESISISGTDPIARIPGSFRTEALGSGSGGDIVIEADRLRVEKGGALQTISYTTGRAGDIFLKVSDAIDIIGFSPRDFRALSSVVSLSFGSSSSGNIAVETRQFTVKDGGLLVSGIIGPGEGGDVEISASELIELSGYNPFVLGPSAISAATGFGSAGEVRINTSRLLLKNGGRIDSSTFASGTGGSVSIDASESVEVSGTVPGSRNPSLIISSANLLDEAFRNFYGIPGNSALTGNSGSVILNTDRLTVSDGASISVQNDGTGNAGTIQINTPSIFLDNSGSISARTVSGEGGNIQISSQDIRLFRNSGITTTAGGSGNGGNIFINTDTLVALENSAIALSSARNVSEIFQLLVLLS